MGRARVVRLGGWVGGFKVGRGRGGGRGGGREQWEGMMGIGGVGRCAR